MIYLEMAKGFESARNQNLKFAEMQLNFRNENIYISYKNGFRQKEIANFIGLSESTIKHIIARMKKNESI